MGIVSGKLEDIGVAEQFTGKNIFGNMDFVTVIQSGVKVDIFFGDDDISGDRPEGDPALRGEQSDRSKVTLQMDTAFDGREGHIFSGELVAQSKIFVRHQTP